MVVYRTYFKLTNCVLDFEEARKYLIEDTMKQYLQNDSRCSTDTYSKILSIEWILKDENSGYIELKTTEELSTEELNKLSDWVRGQNSDGIGESFEQQDFACYEIDEDGEILDSRYSCDYEGEVEEVMASFDWNSNNYIFELISDKI